ncbi:hypothetical protein MBRU_10550 [Mycolicibacterium brumae DSM 44177]|nr:hypothetical protein MBRU_10550 [Mycolicibacterium brumae DSM 44177]
MAVLGLHSVVGLTPTAVADPCTGTVANAQPPQPMPRADTGGNMQPPTGHRPPNANSSAPLPRLGELSRSLISAFNPNAARQQAQVNPAPRPAPVQQQPAPQPQRAPEPTVPAQDVPHPAMGNTPGTAIVGWVTGIDSAANTLNRFGVSGTDLGIMWDNGDPGNNQVLMAFGDTFGYCGVSGQQWRYNVLFRTQDRQLARGINVQAGSMTNQYAGAPEIAPGYAKQIVNSIKWAPTEKGIIPTAGISVGNVQYMNIMSIRNWDSPGHWTTNFSAIAVSPDNGQHWGVYPGSVRTPAPNDVKNTQYTPGNEKFQQGAFLKGGDGYIYSYGTPAGRRGQLFISRVPQNAVPDLSRYEYWNGGSWVANNPGAAAPIADGQVGELSAQYNTYLRQYLIMYGNEAGDVLLRTAPAPQGPFSPPQMVVSAAQTPGGAYAPYLHPWSTGKELYYTLSLWSAYNVMLMKTTLP